MHVEKSGKDEKISYYDGSKMIPKDKLDLKSDGWFLNFSPADASNGVKDPGCVQAKPIYLKGEKSKEDCVKTCSKHSSQIITFSLPIFGVKTYSNYLFLINFSFHFASTHAVSICFTLNVFCSIFKFCVKTCSQCSWFTLKTFSIYFAYRLAESIFQCYF